MVNIEPINHSEDLSDAHALELGEILTQTILTYLRQKFPGVKLNKQSYRIINTFPESLKDDIMEVAGKVVVSFNNKNYYIKLPSSYYVLERKFGTTSEGKGILAKLLDRFKNPSPKNRRGKAKRVVVGVAQNVAEAFSKEKFK